MRSASRIIGKAPVLDRCSEGFRSCSPCPCAYTATEQDKASANAALRAREQDISEKPGPGLSGRVLKSHKSAAKAILCFRRIFGPRRAIAAMAGDDPGERRFQHRARLRRRELQALFPDPTRRGAGVTRRDGRPARQGEL